MLCVSPPGFVRLIACSLGCFVAIYYHLHFEFAISNCAKTFILNLLYLTKKEFKIIRSNDSELLFQTNIISISFPGETCSSPDPLYHKTG